MTRGAIYWHFKDKAHLFNTMMIRATMPLEAVLEKAADGADPLDDIRDWLLGVFRLMAKDDKARRVFDIALHKVEYVEELTEVRDRYLNSYRQWLERVGGRLKTAKRQGLLRPGVDPATAALALCALSDGLLRAWLLNQGSFDLLSVARRILTANLDALRKEERKGAA